MGRSGGGTARHEELQDGFDPRAGLFPWPDHEPLSPNSIRQCRRVNLHMADNVYLVTFLEEVLPPMP